GVRRVDVGQGLRAGASRDGERVAVEPPGVEQGPHDDGHPPDPVDVVHDVAPERLEVAEVRHAARGPVEVGEREVDLGLVRDRERKSTRLNSSHVKISYAVFCLKKKKNGWW